jgi:hypothetical protein
VNISAEHVVLPSDTSFNVSSETLVMKKLSSATLAENGQAATEHTALANGDTTHQNYLTVSSNR